MIKAPIKFDSLLQDGDTVRLFNKDTNLLVYSSKLKLFFDSKTGEHYSTSNIKYRAKSVMRNNEIVVHRSAINKEWRRVRKKK